MTDTEREENKEKKVTIDVAHFELSNAAKTRHEIKYLNDALYNLDDLKKKNKFCGFFSHSLKNPHEAAFIHDLINFTPTPEIIKLVIREKESDLANFDEVINTYIEQQKQYNNVEKEDALVNLYEYGLKQLGFLKMICHIDFKPVDHIMFHCSSHVFEAFKLEGKLDDLSKIGWSITEILPTNINCSLHMNESDHKSEKLARLFQMIHDMINDNVLDMLQISPMSNASIIIGQNRKETRGEL